MLSPSSMSLPDLGIDVARRLLGHVDGLGHRMAEEHFLLVALIAHAPKLVGHAPFHDHRARQPRRHLDVAGCAIGDVLGPEDDELGLAAAEDRGQSRYAILPRVGVLVALGR